jgi:2'-5' RNA ligase
MTRPQPTIRLFVAAYPPRDTAEALTEAARSHNPRDHHALRYTPIEQVHLTLHFIGGVEPRAIDSITDSIAHAALGIDPFTLTPQRLITLPRNKRDVRLIAAETDAPGALMELHRRLVTRLAQNPRRSGGKLTDGYLPHLTLARFRKGSESKRAQLGEAPWAREAGAPIDPTPFEVTAIALVRSNLKPEGAAHDQIAAFALNA